MYWDAINTKLTFNTTNSIKLGKNTGNTDNLNPSQKIAIGENASGNQNISGSLSTNTIAIGYESCKNNNGSNIVAIGYNSCINNTNKKNNIIMINANPSFSPTISNDGSLFISPVRRARTDYQLCYDNKEYQINYIERYSSGSIVKTQVFSMNVGGDTPFVRNVIFQPQILPVDNYSKLIVNVSLPEYQLIVPESVKENSYIQGYITYNSLTITKKQLAKESARTETAFPMMGIFDMVNGINNITVGFNTNTSVNLPSKNMFIIIQQVVI